jgi:uncharacterized protein (TIGR03435 family)
MRRSLPRRGLLGAFVGVLAVQVVGHAQSDQKPATFDVAAIKQNTSGDTQGQFGGPASRFTATNVPALQFILFAYRLRDFQIEGAPDWLKTDRWDINARADGSFPPATIDGPDPRRDMLRGLLADRFKLSAHTESRDALIYALVVAQPGRPLPARLHPSTLDCAALLAGARRDQRTFTPPVTPDGVPDCSIAFPPGRLNLGTQPMRQFAAVLSEIVRRPVVDRTSVSGNYSASITYTPDNAARQTGADQPADDVSIFTALQEQLGLKLESTRGPVDVLVIDHIERPTPD